MSTETLRLAASRVVLGLLHPEDLEGVARAALAGGCDSRSLRMLAGSIPAEAGGARTLFDRALSELDLARPSKREAVMLLAREEAKRLVEGTSDPYHGAKRIWELTLRAPEECLPELDTFVYGASEWEDRPEDRRVFERGIMIAARELAGA